MLHKVVETFFVFITKFSWVLTLKYFGQSLLTWKEKKNVKLVKHKLDKFPPVKYILTKLYEIFCTALFNMHCCICYDVSRVVHELVELVSKQSFVRVFPPPYFLDVDLPFSDLILLLFCFYILLYKRLPFCLVGEKEEGEGWPNEHMLFIRSDDGCFSFLYLSYVWFYLLLLLLSFFL